MILYIQNLRGQYINPDFYAIAKNYSNIKFINKEDINKYDLTKVSAIIRPTISIGDLAKQKNPNIKLYNLRNAGKICDDKWLSYLELDKYNFPQPKTSLDYTDLEFPMVMKVRDSSFAKHVWLVNNIEDINRIKSKLTKRKKLKLMYQEYIKESFGKAVRVVCIDKKVRFYYMRINDNDFRANLVRGAHVEQMESLDESITKLCNNICEKLDLNYVGLDILLGDNNKPIVCELNNNALTHNYKDATGIDIQKWYVEYLVAEDLKLN